MFSKSISGYFQEPSFKFNYINVLFCHFHIIFFFRSELIFVPPSVLVVMFSFFSALKIGKNFRRIERWTKVFRKAEEICSLNMPSLYPLMDRFRPQSWSEIAKIRKFWKIGIFRMRFLAHVRRPGGESRLFRVPWHCSTGLWVRFAQIRAGWSKNAKKF